jgi:hypothetical protein
MPICLLTRKRLLGVQWWLSMRHVSIRRDVGSPLCRTHMGFITLWSCHDLKILAALHKYVLISTTFRQDYV